MPLVFKQRRDLPRATVPVLAALSLPLFVLCQGLAKPYSLDIGQGMDESFLRGFTAPIHGDKLSYRWSGPDSELRLHGWVGRGARLALRLDAGPGTDPRRLIFVEPDTGRELASLSVASGWRTYAVEIPASPAFEINWLGPTRVGLRAERYRPGPDGRPLGFKVSSARAEPVSVSWWHAIVRGLNWTWQLALASALALWLSARVGSGQSRWIAAAALAFAGASALALALSLLLNLPLTAWLLPPTPVACALLSLPWAWKRARAPLLCAATRLRGRLGKAGVVAAALASLAALGLLYARVSLAYSAPLAVLSVAALLLLIAPHTAQLDAASGGAAALPDASGTTRLLTAALVIAVAFGLRFYRITDLPYGMFRDDARNGLAALQIIEDPRYRPIFVKAVDIPAGGIYACIPSFQLFGIRPWTMRVVTALAGALTVIPLAFVARRLTQRWDTALMAAGLLAASVWHVTVSRVAFTYVFDPLVQLSALAVFAYALDERHGRWAGMLWSGLAGALLGLAPHAHHTGRLAPLIGVAFALCLAAGSSALRPRRILLALAPAGVAFALVSAPLYLYAVLSPDQANARIAQVSLLSHALRDGDAPLAALDVSLGRHLLMLHVRGDSLGRHNLPGQPQLDPVAGLGLLAGLILLAYRPRDPRVLFVFGALLLSLMPSLLSVDGPRATRALNVLPYAAILAAVGIGRVLAPATGLRRRAWLPAGLTAASAACAFVSYFVVAPHDPAVWRSFYPVETQVGAHLRSLADRGDATALSRTYVPAPLANEWVTRYLAHGLRFGVYDADGLHPSPDGALQVIVPAGTDPAPLRDLARASGRRESSTAAGPLLPDGLTPAYTVIDFD